jgi:outer membrane protein TolC
MRGTEGRTGRRRHRLGWKAAGTALLGLMGGSVGCQWTGDHSPPRSVLEPPTAVTPHVHYQPPTATEQIPPRSGGTTVAPPQSGASDRTILQTGGVNAGAEAPVPPPAVADAGVVQASAPFGPDAPTPEDDVSRMERVPEQYHATNRPTTLPAVKSADEDRDPKTEKWPSGKDQGYKVDRTLPSPMAGAATPVIPAPKKSQPITLGASLALAGVENPIIAIAQQAVQVSLAEQLQARTLLLPNVNVGANYHYHDGPVQASFGGIRKVTSDLVSYGLGTNTVAAESMKIPGLFIFTPLADAVYEPLIARQVVANRRFASTATRNEVLLEVSLSYLALLRAEGRVAVIHQSEADFGEVVRLTKNFATSGQGRKGDADRAEADLLALQYQEQQAQEDVAVASAELARLLNLDPSTRLLTGEVPIQVVQFIDPKEPLPKLLQIAARNRPELLAAAANIRASDVRVTQEKTRPLFPTLWMGFSADDFGGGAVASTSGNVFNPHGSPSPGGAASVETGGQTVPKFGRITGRTDVDVMAIWTLQNLGVGNLAHVKQRRAQRNQAVAQRVRMLNQVAFEVTEAYNLSAAHLRSIELQRSRVKEAMEGFQRDLDRIRGGLGFPIEVLNNAKRLSTARQALLEEIIGFDRSQFQLFVALGQPPTMVVEEEPIAPH